MAGKYWWEDDEKQSDKQTTTQATTQSTTQTEKKYWWEDDTKQTATQNNVSGHWWDDNNYASIVGNDVTNKVNSWLQNHNSFISNYQKRNAGRKYTYEDAYVSDSADWMNKASQQKTTYDAEADAILSYLDQNKDYLDKGWLEQIKSTITSARGTQSQILEGITKDNEYWAKFTPNEEQTAAGYTAEKLYNEWQTGQKQYAEDQTYDVEAGLLELEGLKKERDAYLAEQEEKRKQAQEDESFWDSLGRWLGTTPDTTIPLAGANDPISNERHTNEYDKRIAELEERIERSKYVQGYEGYMDNIKAADYVTNNQYASTRTDVAMDDARYGIGEMFSFMGGEGDKYDKSKLFGDFLYDYINRNPDALAAAQVNDAADLSYFLGFDKGFLQTMSDDEIGVYNYLYKTQGKESANEYLSFIENDLQGRRRAQEQAFWAAYAKESPVGSSVFSTLMAPLKGVSYLGQAADMLDDGKMEENAGYNRFSYIPSTIRSQVSTTIENSGKWGKVGSFAYNTGMSMADFLFTTAVSGGNQALSLGIMGTGAAADATLAAKDRGLDDGDAFALGTIAGLAEVAMEKISLGAWLEGDMTEGALRYVLKNALSEGGEEAGTSMINLLADVMIAGDKSEWNMAMQAYIDQGKSPQEAFGLVAAEQAAQIGLDALGGILSGAAIGGGNYARASAVAGINYRKDAKNKEFAQKIVAEGLELNPESQYVQKAQSKLEKGKNLTGMQVRNILAANKEQITANDMQKIQQAAEKRLTDLGQTKDVSKVAELATKWATGQELNPIEKRTLTHSEYGSRVANELLPKNIQSGGYATEWAENIGTKQVHRESYDKEAYNKELLDKWRAHLDEIVKPATYKSLEERVSKDEKLSVSKSGQATIRETDEAIDLGKARVAEFITDKETGKITDMTLEADGKNVKASEIEYADGDQSYLFSAVSKIENVTPADATAIIRDYDPSSGLSVSEYLNGVDEGFTYGYRGYSEADLSAGYFTTKLSEEQAKSAYMLGQAAKKSSKTNKTEAFKRMRTAVEAEVEKAKAEGKEAPKAKKMTITFNDKGKIVDFDKAGLKKLNPEQKAAPAFAEVMHEMGLGTNFELYASYVNAEGKRVYINENGVEDDAPAGIYRKSDGTVCIDLNAYNGKELTLDSMAHELTHFIQQWSDEKYQVLADFLIKTYEKTDLSMNKRVLREQARLKNIRKKEVSYDEAFDEVVANAMSKMLADGKVMEKLTELKAQDADLAHKLWAGLKKLLNKFFRVYEKYPALFDDAADLMELKAEFEQMQKMWAEAFVEASENFQAAQTIGFEMDAETESVSPAVMHSEQTWTESDYVQQRDKAAEEIAKAIGVTKKKAKDYIDSINSIAKMIAEDRSRLDYFSSPGRTSFVGNVEYGGSFDFSTLCKKRRLLTGTFTAIQKALPNTALTADEILDIRNRMKEANLEVSCGLCYVEGSRANMGQFAKEFLRLYKQYYPDAWQPNMADVNTPDGIEWVRINHPECYEQYEYFWNHYGTLKEGDKNLFASQQKPKLYQLHTEYKGEVLQKFKDDDNVEEKNLNGGIRLQSFSDFEIVHLIDTMQIIMDMSRVGLAGQAYTKVPDFAWALGDTGLKINLSLIAKGVDANGKLIFDDVEGMPIAEAMKLRDRYSKNVGTILVAFNDEQLLAAMADDRVDFIIPFHRSQWKKSQYEAMGLPAKTKDYTFMQNEKYIKPQFHEYRGRMVKDKATNYMPNEYWDFSKSGKENAEAYLEMCARNNKRPKFYKLLQNNGDGSYSLKADGSTDGYWKLLIDFKMYDNEGNGSPQMPVKPEFNMEEANRMLNDYKGGHSNFPVAQGIVDSFVKDYKATHKGEQYSSQDTDRDFDGKSYDEIMEEQQKLYQRERDLLDRKRRAESNPELLQAMDDYSVLFDEARTLFAKRHKGTATQAELDRIEEIKALREERLKRVSELQESLGLSAMEQEMYNVRAEKEALRVASDEALAREGAEKENKAIEKAGISAPEYFRNKALKAFKTTTNFNEAGYLLPDGKLLNFSGGERNHRYRDHREIGEIYEATQGAAALNRFLSDGNIRIMAESPGIDLTSSVEPTKEQYAELRRFINTNGVKDGQFFVDFSDKEGHRAGNYSYNGRVNADRIINDIKYFYQTGSVRESSGLTNFLYSSQETDADHKDHPYSYNTLISKPDMVVTTVDINVPKNRADVVYQAKQNAAKVGKFDPKTGSVSVYVDDVGENVVLGTPGLKHGLEARREENSIVTLKAGEILKHSIRINELTPKKDTVDGSYVLVGAAKSDDGSFYIVRSVINKVSHNLISMDVLYAINAKKGNRPSSMLPGFQGPVTDSTITIAELLDLVNQYFPDILPEDVLKHYGYDARPEGDLGKDALYSTQETDLDSHRHQLANAFEGITNGSEEYKLIQKYKGYIAELNSLENKLREFNREIHKIRFTEGEYDAEKLRKLENEAGKIAGAISKYDQYLLSLEASEPLRKVIERERKKEAQKTKEHVKEIQQNKKVRAEQTELRHKIRKAIRDLDKILNRGNKQRNVKEDLQPVVTKALQAAEILFTDNYGSYDMLRNGIGADMSDAEEALVESCAKMLKDLDKMPTDGYENWQARQEAENRLKTKMSKLKDVFARERKRLNNTTVSSILGELADAYASLEKSEQSYVQGAYSEAVHNFLKSLQSEVGGTIVSDMTKAQLESVYAAYKMVLTTVRKANQMFNEELKLTREQLGNAVIEEVLKAGGVHLLGTKLGDAISQADWNNMKPIWVANRIGSDTFGKLVNGLFKGQYNFAVDVDEAKRFKLEMDEKYHPRSWDTEKLYEFESSTGKKFSLNLQQIMSLYAFSKRDQAYSHLLNGGFVFENNSTVIVEKNGIKRTYIHKGATSYKLNEATLNGIINSLTAEQKAYADEMQKYLSEVMGAKGNEVSMQLYGIKMFNEQFYFPLRSSGAYMERAKEAEMKKQQGQINLVNSGFTHAVKPEAKNPIVLSGFMDVWAEHCNEMSMYHSMVLPMEDFRKVYNYSTVHDEKMESASVFQTIQDAYGQAATNYIDQLYRELNASATIDPRETSFKARISNFKKAAVMLSGSVVVQQFSSIGRAYAVIDPKYFIGTKVNSGTQLSVVEEMKKYAPVAIIKEMGGFDTGTKGSAKAYIVAEKYGNGERIQALVKDEQYRGDIMGYLPAKADEKTWCAIWEAVKRETKANHPDMDVKSEEFLKLAGERFSDVIEKTQVYDSVLARSANMRSKSGLMQMATAFMAEPTTTVNLIEDAIRRGNKKYIARAFGAVAVSIVLNNALASIVYAMRDDDEDETFIEKYFQSFTSGMIDDINPMSYYPFLKDVYSLFQGYDVERADMSVIADVRDAMKKVVGLLGKDTSSMDDDELAAHYKQVNEVLMGLLDAGCSMFGVPVKNVRRDAMSIINAWNTVGKDITERDTTWNSFWDKVGAAAKDTIPIYAWTKDKAKTDKLYDAIISGDKSYLARLKSTYKTDSAYETAVRKALRENDSRIQEAAQARYNGNAEEYKRIFREIKNEGRFSFDDIMSAINTELSKLEPDKVTSDYTATGYVEAIAMGNMSGAEAMKDDIIATKVANGKTQEEADEEFATSVATGIQKAYSSGLLDEARAEEMLMEYAGKDEEEAASKVSYWSFLDEHPEYKDVFTESHVEKYHEFAEPADISVDVYAQFINGTKGLTDIKDELGDVEVSKREQVLEVIDSLDLTWQQKDALYLAAGYAESKIWDVPW